MTVFPRNTHPGPPPGPDSAAGDEEITAILVRLLPEEIAEVPAVVFALENAAHHERGLADHAELCAQEAALLAKIGAQQATVNRWDDAYHWAGVRARQLRGSLMTGWERRAVHDRDAVNARWSDALAARDQLDTQLADLHRNGAAILADRIEQSAHLAHERILRVYGAWADRADIVRGLHSWLAALADYRPDAGDIPPLPWEGTHP